MTARAASRPVPRWAHHALLFAAGWLLFLSTLAPVLQLNAEAWTPVHAHASLEGIVPPHTHAYDRDADTRTASSTASCAEDGSGVVCTPGQDVTGAPALLAAAGPAEVPLGPALTSPSRIQRLARYLAPSLPTLVPPPRG